MTGGERAPGGRARLAFAAAAALLLVLAVLHQRHDARERAAVERFFATFTLDVRRPEMLETARVEVAADLAKQVAVRAAALDVAGSTPLDGMTPQVRELWLRSVRELPEEVAAARALALEAVAARPAWAFHSLALAGLVVSDEWRAPEEERLTARWLAPLRLAAAWAPKLQAPWTAWGSAALRRWPLLSVRERVEAKEALRRALQDQAFQRSAFVAVVRALGPEEGLALLPAEPEALAVAKEVLSPRTNFEGQVILEERWRAAERAERAREAAAIAAAVEAGRADRALDAAYEFLRRHPVELFDDDEGRAQARVVLDAVGDGRPGAWTADPRGRLVRWFLANPGRPGPGGGLARAARGLTGMSDGTRAWVSLLSGDDFAWRRVVAQADTKGASEWTPLYVELARRALAAGNTTEAEEALSKVSRFDLGRCEVLLVRRAVARARQRAGDLADLEAAWVAAFPTVLDVAAWPASGPGSLALCVDPERDAEARLYVTVRAEGPSLSWWGWDGGREGVVRGAGGEEELSFPLAGLRGLRTFSLGPLVGPPVRPLSARIGAAPAPAPPSK